jgi:hypothetical protein
MLVKILNWLILGAELRATERVPKVVDRGTACR